MPFYFAKTMLQLALPPASLLMLVALGGLLMLFGLRKTGAAASVSGILLIYLLSTSAVSNMLITPLEKETEPFKNSAYRPDAVVVLTSGANDLSHLGLEPAPSLSSMYSLVEGTVVLRKTRSPLMIICGGAGDPARPWLSEGAALAGAALELGIPRGSLRLEDKSRNTQEGAEAVAKMLGGKGKKIILVASAAHIGRAAGLFRKTGLEVAAAPANYLGSKPELNLFSFLPSAHSLEASAAAVYEYLCRIRYSAMLKELIGNRRYRGLSQ